MKILLSNDDGIDSDGIRILKTLIQQHHPDAEIWVVAPDGERSGMSHSITLRDSIRARKIGEREYQTSGSPADCVMTAVMGIMDGRPDVIVSGINRGPNLGTDITYSGTAAAARQGAYMNIPSIAVSLNGFHPPLHYAPLAETVAKNLAAFIRIWDEHHFININGPNIPGGGKDIRITYPGRRLYKDALEWFDAPSGDRYWFLAGQPVDNSDEPGSDWEAVSQNLVSISPVHLHPLNNEIDSEYEQTNFII